MKWFFKIYLYFRRYTFSQTFINFTIHFYIPHFIVKNPSCCHRDSISDPNDPGSLVTVKFDALNCTATVTPLPRFYALLCWRVDEFIRRRKKNDRTESSIATVINNTRCWLIPSTILHQQKMMKSAQPGVGKQYCGCWGCKWGWTVYTLSKDRK